MTYIKTDPVFQEDQEDLLMSYLNSDYMAPSTVSPSPTTPKLNSTQGLNYSATTAISGFDDSEDNWHSTPSTPNDDLFRQQQAIVSCFHPDVLNGSLQFIIPSHDQMQQQPIIAYIENAAPNMMNTSQYFPSQQQQQQQQQQQYQQHQLLQQRSASPRSLSSYSSSSDSEQLNKKRGRKKRASCHSIASSNSCGSLTPPPTSASNTPAAIAPAPTKHLPAILPAASNNNQIQDSVVPRNHDNQKSSISKNESVINAQSSHITNQAYTGSTTAIGLFVNPNTDLQKAAIIAKRQERLIKNRAAALLSRKRKREHLSALEEQCTDLTNVNQSLLDKVSQLEKENQDLKKILDGKQQNVTTEKFSGDIISMVKNQMCM